MRSTVPPRYPKRHLLVLAALLAALLTHPACAGDGSGAPEALPVKAGRAGDDCSLISADTSAATAPLKILRLLPARPGEGQPRLHGQRQR